MATKHSSKPNAPVDASAGWEKRDVNIRGLFQFAFWMAVVLAVTLVGMKFSFDSFKKAQPMGATMSPMVKPTDRMIPPGPLLQVRPHQELQDYCAAQQQDVNSYAWVDQQSGVVRIPVERAMELILARGLPARAANEASGPGSYTPVAPPTVAGETDVQGQCGYLTEPTEADKERAAAAGEAKE
ncbi:MAG: hypothetical protein WB949_06335 [Candidatus Acidiferrales bacterium]